MDCDLWDRLDIKTLGGAVKEYLEQSSRACDAGKADEMLDLARSARLVALECRDTLGEATALVLVGLAYFQMSRFDQARRSFAWAQRIFHRDPSWRSRLNEGLALYELGRVYALENSHVSAVASFQKARELLEGIRDKYWTAADDDKVALIDGLLEELKGRVSAQISPRYEEIEAADATVALPEPDPTGDELPLSTQDKDAAWNERFDRDTLGSVQLTEED